MELHDDHGFPNFTTREKVLFLTRGIETGAYNLPLFQIDGDTTGAHSNFELAQLVLLGFKSILDNHSNRNTSSTRSQGQGDRGPGRGPGTGSGSPARGNLCRGNGGGSHYGPGGGDREGACGSSSNRFTHKTIMGGQALNWPSLVMAHGIPFLSQGETIAL